MPPEWLLYGAALALGGVNALLTAYWYRRVSTGETVAGPTPTPAPEGAVRCRRCDAENDDSYRYCRECASRLPRVTARDGEQAWPTGRGSL